jgi:glycosyltransferase involved in cell wall biosynthesis
MKTRPAMFLAGYESPDLSGKIAQGFHPRVEYLCLMDRFGMHQFSFADLNRLGRGPLRPVVRRLRPCVGLGLVGRLFRSVGSSIIATGEDVGIPLAMLQRLTGGRRKVSIITHGSYFGSQKFARIAPLLKSNPNLRFLCLSESLCRQLIQQHGFSNRQVYNVGYGVDTCFFSPDSEKDTPVIPRQIAAAGMAKRDYKSLVAATQELDVSVKIAADSAWFRTGLDIESEELPSNVEARSYGDYPGLRRLYAQSAFVVVPLRESVHACGYAVIAEAMAMGKPVITTDITGRSDYIVEGETGFYVPPQDVQALKNRISFLLDNPKVALEMGQKARSLIESRFTLERYCDQIADAAGLSTVAGEGILR